MLHGFRLAGLAACAAALLLTAPATAADCEKFASRFRLASCRWR